MRTSALIRGALLVAMIALASAARPQPAAADTWLGVYTQEITPELREGMSYNGKGVLVRRVVSGSPADQAGIERGDIIVRVGSRDVDTPETLVDAVRSSPGGKPATITVVRGNEKKALTATLESRDDVSGDRDELEWSTPPRAPEPPEAPEAPEAPRVHVYHGDPDGDGDFDFHGPGPTMIGSGRARLGVRVESLNPDLASYFGGRDTRGALVLDVTDDSPAAKAGIRAGDVITKVGTKPIADANDLIEAVRSTEGKVSVTLVRHGAKQTLETTLEPMGRTLRVRRPRSSTWTYETPERRSYSGTPKRIVIDGDELNPQIRAELERMQQDLKQMREQLERMREDVREPEQEQDKEK